MAEGELSPRLGADYTQMLALHAVTIFEEELRLLLRNFKQDGRLPGQPKLTEQEELALLQQQAAQNAMTAMQHPDDLARYQAVTDIARQRELEAKYHGTNGSTPS